MSKSNSNKVTVDYNVYPPVKDQCWIGEIYMNRDGEIFIVSSANTGGVNLVSLHTGSIYSTQYADTMYNNLLKDKFTYIPEGSVLTIIVNKD